MDSLENIFAYSSDGKTILAFHDMFGIFTGEVPYGAESFADGVFAGSNVKKITVPESVKFAGAGLFENCKLLTNVELPSSLTELSPRMFAGCSLLRKVVIPFNTSAFPYALFSGCSSLADIPFRAGLIELQEDVFAGCTSLKSLVIPDTVKIIHAGAVADCTSLETLVLPASLQTLEQGAFAGCTSLRHIRISEDNPVFFVDENDGCLYSRRESGDIILEIAICGKKPVENKNTEFENKIETQPCEIKSTEQLCVHEQDGAPAEETAVSCNETVWKEQTAVYSERITEDEAAARAAAIFAADEKILSDDWNDEQCKVEEHKPESVPEKETDKNCAKERQNIYEVKGTEVSTAAIMPQEHPVTEKKSVLDQAIERLTSSVAKYEHLSFIPSLRRHGIHKTLVVLAERLVSDKNGGHFSQTIKKCSTRLASVHGYSDVFFLYGIPFNRAEVLILLRDCLASCDVLLACDMADGKISDNAKKAALLSGINLNGCMTEHSSVLRLAVQDDYSA